MRDVLNQPNEVKAADSYAAWGQRGTAGAAFAAGVTFENVERRYRDNQALRGVTLHVEPASILCLLGPSGCGKTTLLRLAAGIEKPSAGRVLLSGLEVSGPDRFVPPERRSVGLMFQDFALFPHLTILDNVAFGLNALSRNDARSQAMTGLGRVGLARYAAQYPHVLSGGEQQRVALARAMAPRPAVLLMDEPFSGLDVQLRESMQEETLTLLRETRTTAIIVTHHPGEAMRLADRIAVMRAGQIVQEGDAETLYRAPQDLFVARLFSEINEVPGEVRGGRVEAALGTFPAPGFANSARVIVCVRQRGVRVLPAGEGVAGRIVATKFLGDAVRLEIAVQGLESRLKALVVGDQSLVKGAEIGVKVDAADTLVFASETKDQA